MRCTRPERGLITVGPPRSAAPSPRAGRGLTPPRSIAGPLRPHRGRPMRRSVVHRRSRRRPRRPACAAPSPRSPTPPRSGASTSPDAQRVSLGAGASRAPAILAETAPATRSRPRLDTARERAARQRAHPLREPLPRRPRVPRGSRWSRTSSRRGASTRSRRRRSSSSAGRSSTWPTATSSGASRSTGSLVAGREVPRYSLGHDAAASTSAAPLGTGESGQPSTSASTSPSRSTAPCRMGRDNPLYELGQWCPQRRRARRRARLEHHAVHRHRRVLPRVRRLRRAAHRPGGVHRRLDRHPREPRSTC